MKQIVRIVAIVLVPLLIGIGCREKKGRLVGTLPAEMQGEYAYISALKDSKAFIDSIEVKDAANFTYSLEKLQPNHVYLLTLKAIGQQIPFVVQDEVGDLTLDTKKFLIRGGKDNDALAGYLEKSYEMFEDETLADSVFFAYGKQFFDSYKDSEIGYFGFDLCRRAVETPLQLEPLLKKAGDALMALPVMQKALRNLDNLKKTLPGNSYVDIEGIDASGDSVRLSEYVAQGQYVLLDFWASWCGPCRKELKNLKKVYEKYRGKGLAIIGVSVWDELEEHRKAVAAEGISWPQIFTAKDSDATEKYGIMGIPQIMLVGPDGVIVARDLRDAAIEEIIAPLYR